MKQEFIKIKKVKKDFKISKNQSVKDLDGIDLDIKKRTWLQRKIIAIARSIAANPEFLILDEPTGS